VEAHRETNDRGGNRSRTGCRGRLCNTECPPAAVETTPAVRLLEAEDLRLTSAEVVMAEGASNGKAIRLIAQDARATTDVTLPAGQYLVNVAMKSVNEASDGLYLFVANKVKRTSNQNFNRWAFGLKFLIFESDGLRPLTIGLASTWDDKGKEFGMLVDYFEIVELTRSVQVLERWTK
jgi:hypothetical protein